MIDRKFKFVATNPCKGNAFTEENAIVFLAKDRAVPGMLLDYYDRCEDMGCGADHLESVALLQDRVVEFQKHNESKIPDTETPCEIDRCIGGKV